MSETEQTILAAHSGALGDVVLFGRILAALAGEVTLVARGDKGRLLAGLGVVRRAMDFDGLPIHEVFGDAPPGDCALAGLLGPHDRLVSCFAAGDRRGELRLAAMCGAGDAAFLPIRPDGAGEGHLLDTWCEMLSVDCTAEAWPVPPAWQAEAGRALGDLGLDAEGGYAVIHPGAGAAEKCWPLDDFVAVGGTAFQAVGIGHSLKDCATVFVLGPVEMDRWSAETIEDLRAKVPVVVCPSLPVLAGLLAGARAYVGNDSGTSHLAAAVGAPTVALFGPTRPEQFSPRGPRVIALRREPISTMTVLEVIDAVRTL